VILPPANDNRAARAIIATSLVLLLAGALLDLNVVRAADEPAVEAADSTRSDTGLLSLPLRLVSLNIAHGRKSGLNQALESEKTIRSNLRDVAAFLERTNPSIVALQEADAPSRWSGSFDHVAFLAAAANYPWHALAPHASSWVFEYGTALLSRAPFVEVVDHAFAESPPTATKGFVLGCVALRTNGHSKQTVELDLVSVHLDFSRKSVRHHQVEEMAHVLSGRTRPLVVMGDFNSDWAQKNSAVRQFADARGLRAYRPEAEGLNTFPGKQDRLDWILISPDLEFTRYEVFPDRLSDHLAVLAEVQLRRVASPGDKLPGVE